jgi:RNA polymerase sigma-70 factor (ECF subfamily)
MHIISRKEKMRSFEDLYAQYADDIYRFALWLSDDPMEAEDITAETFVRAWLRFRSIRMETLKGYLLKIARNIFLTMKRKARRDTQLADNYPDPSPGPESMAQAHITLADVKSFLQTLPECDRSAFVLRVLYDLSYGEIARVLEVSEVAARVKVHRTRKKLLFLTMKEQDG